MNPPHQLPPILECHVCREHVLRDDAVKMLVDGLVIITCTVKCAKHWMAADNLVKEIEAVYP